MTEQRQKLLDRFDKWLDSKPRKQIISAQCANIAEEYAEEQLRLHNVSQQRELLLQAFKDGFQAATESIIGANELVKNKTLQQSEPLCDHNFKSNGQGADVCVKCGLPYAINC
jgi:dsDNA-binding SOS-regulon protein